MGRAQGPQRRRGKLGAQVTSPVTQMPERALGSRRMGGESSEDRGRGKEDEVLRGLPSAETGRLAGKLPKSLAAVACLFPSPHAGLARGRAQLAPLA